MEITNENMVDEIILFTIGEVVCGLDIKKIREIKRYLNITQIHGAPTEVRGVINLRGEIVTVLDIRKRFGYSKLKSNGKERVIFVPFKEETIGILVDFVDDVIGYNPEELLPVPPNMDNKTAHFFSAVLQQDNSIISLINLDELLTFNDEPNSGLI